ncbi:hypothetical protein BD324DRAFT_653107 [Kockovaella imperatae]|uniref:Transcription factor domain-containing protein n=1 Tax=Kockovaella imperatae TaxID=4999 RepID=A0A1Y1UA16_9TREE|nr:hypothetical protein BD324DRAFT_653107 [Kockovaella imperatae]ORX34852.1 hypothetical protein BD324DRAFT_653107 [Kockovaella imperatae]
MPPKNGRDEGPEEDSDSSAKQSGHERGQPPKKRRGGIRVALKAKVGTLETQMSHVQATLDKVVSLLQHNEAQPRPGTLVKPPNPAPFSLEDWVQKNAHASTSANSNNLVPAMHRLEPVVGSGDDDEDGESEDTEALGLMRGMLKREASRRLREDGHPVQRTREGFSGRRVDQIIGANDQSPNRRRIDSLDDTILSVSRHSGELTEARLDPIALGLCSEAEARTLFDLFFALAHPFMPVFDPSEDNWLRQVTDWTPIDRLSLRTRSAFALTAVLFVAKKIQEAGQPMSRTQAVLREQAEKLAKETIFSPVSSIEALQGMILLASWGDTGWRPGSHCLSMAFDMGLYRCLPRLQRRKGDRLKDGKSPLEYDRSAVDEKRLIVGARLWLLVVKMAIEMSYNHGRPLLITDTDVLANADALLDHPLSLPSDSRLIASCELLILRVPLFRVTLSETYENHDQALRIFNDGAPGWERRWTKYYIAKGVSEDDILLTDLSTQLCFAIVIANSSLLRYVEGPGDVSSLSLHRREWLLSALESAGLVARRILGREKYKLKGANHYSHVALAGVARIYIRLATLFPEHVDQRQAANDITQLADVLDTFPGVHFAQQLRHVVQKARRKGVFGRAPHVSSRTMSDTHSIESSSSHQVTQSPLDFDIFLAEQMLNTSNVGPVQPDLSDPFAGLFDTGNPTAGWESFNNNDPFEQHPMPWLEEQPYGGLQDSHPYQDFFGRQE